MRWFSTSEGVQRSGPPCAAQLFDLFKYMAGANADADFGQDETAESEENEVPTNFPPQGERPSSATWDNRSYALADDSHPHVTPQKTRPSTPSQAESENITPNYLEEAKQVTERERNSLSARLCAMSLGNLSNAMLFHSGKKVRRRTLPLKNQDPSPEIGAKSSSILLTPSASLDDYNIGAFGDSFDDMPLAGEDITDEEKVAAIIREFGDIASLCEDQEPERILAESKGSIFKSVMMIGNLHLTTHRLLFHASIPPDYGTKANVLSSLGSAADDATIRQPDVLQAGPVTIHYPEAIRPSRRVWMELSSEMVTTYPGADEASRVRPLKSVLLSSVRRINPIDHENPCDFYVEYETATGWKRGHFSVDTEQSAGQWRRAFQSALFRQARFKWRQSSGLSPPDNWSMMRVCIPLSRVTLKGITSYQSFATLIGMDVGIDAMLHPALSPLSSIENQLGDALHKPKRIRPHSISSIKPPALPFSRTASRKSQLSSLQAGDADAAKSFDTSNSYSASQDNLKEQKSLAFNIAVLNEQVWFAEALQSAVNASKLRKYAETAKEPKIVLEVDGHDCLAADDELELKSLGSPGSNESEEDEDSGDGLLQQTRKREKAFMAAKVFGLKEEEGIWMKRCYIITSFLPVRGHIIITPRYICFWRRVTVGTDIRYRFPVEDVENVISVPGIRAHFYAFALQIKGHEDLRFEFWKQASRDEVMAHIKSLAGKNPVVTALGSRSSLSRTPDSGKQTFEMHPADVLAPSKSSLFEPLSVTGDCLPYLPFVANQPLFTARLKPRTFVCLTIGSRGDVQPYIALGLGLKNHGHKVVIVTHSEFKDWVEGYGIEHREAGGDPTVLMKLSQEHKMLSPGFFKESLRSFRQWLDNLLLESWQACKDADVLIESPSAMAGIHIAEALKIPYFRAFTMPWTRTSAYPQAFLVPTFEMGPSFNYATYVLFDNIMWKATAPQINRWRKKYLNLKPTDLSTLSITKVPFLYNFSPSVVPKPLDWHDDVIITGYWNLEDSDRDWVPPTALEEFIVKANEKGRPIVYIGFGSIVVPQPDEMTQSIIKAVEKANVWAIIAKGWSSRGGDPAKEGQNITFPESCYGIDKVPHAWLFPRVRAALHHGGAGTVGASLRAGIPTLIKPWFGDQFFWSIRVSKLGVGLKVPSLRPDDVASALIKATSDRVMIEKAARIGERIRSENGVATAISAISYNISRAASDRRTAR
ncbi:sterol 3beta-glucosyltransferase [Cryptococcus deuterogattii MMRL2647]|nr:sterol 3beta-glucosyltransferase [Cryptococcus deuterogattii MMRL2647]